MIGPPGARLQPFFELASALVPLRATVAASRLTVRLPFAVFGVPSVGTWLTAMTVCQIAARPLSRSRAARAAWTHLAATYEDSRHASGRMTGKR